MGWATVLLSGVVAGVVSALVSWFAGLHRDKRAAEQQVRFAETEMAHRREDVRRDRLTDALVEFLALDRARFDVTSRFMVTVTEIVDAMGSSESMPLTDQQREELGGALEEMLPRTRAAEDALQRVRLYAPALYDLALSAHVVTKFDFDAESEALGAARGRERYRQAVGALLSAARTELGIVV